jgi:stalled ribosome rescue protein Dom34
MTYATVWIDHREARVFHIAAAGIDEVTVRTPQHIHRRHPKGESGAKEHPDDAKHFFHEVAHALEGATHILAVGPSTAKDELVKYAQDHDRPLAARIVGTETVDHPTDGQLVASARAYFQIPAHA